MSLLRPATSRILTSMLIEFEKTVQPEIQSPRARFVGTMIAYLLQMLAIREGQGDEIAATSLPVQIGHLREAAALLGDDAIAALAEEIEAMATDPHRLHEAQAKAATALEENVQRLIAQGPGSSAVHKDAIDRLLSSEIALVDRIDPPVLAPGESFSAAMRTSDGISVEGFNRYLAGRFPGQDIAATAVTRLMGGFSKDTFIIALEGRDRPADEIVLRRDAPSGPIDASVRDEYPVIAGLFGQGFPVAEPFWLEPEASHFGSSFLTARRVDGMAYVHADGATLLVERAVGEKAARGLARMLARLHTADITALGYSAQDAALPAREHVLRLIDEFEDYWQARKAGPEPIMAAAFEWLRRNIPEYVPGPSVVHGDAALRNLLAVDGTPTALLDWETVHLGDPSEDLAYARREIELVMDWDDFLAEYYAAGGPRYHQENAVFFELWASVRNGAYSLPHGFIAAAVPDIRFAFSSAFYHRGFLRNISAFLRKHG